MSDTHSHAVAFVRTEDVPAAPPPSNAAGPVKWTKDNLFATPANSVLTILALLAIFFIVQGIFPWLANGVWNSPSLMVCRQAFASATDAEFTQILAQMQSGYDTYGATFAERAAILAAADQGGITAAMPLLSALTGKELLPESAGCFAVLTERWNQLLFGFQYPTDIYWRPTVAFALLFVAAAPVLFFDLPRKLLILTGLYPFVAYYLIWGGSFYTPIIALLGVVAAIVVFQLLVKRSFALAFFGAIAAAFAVWIIGGMIAPEMDTSEGAMRAIPSRDLGGFMLNMMLGVTCVSLSLPIGIALALGRQSSMPLIKYICVVFIEFVRGVPLITLLFVASVMLAYFFPPGSGVDLFLRVVIMITLFSAAYIAEVIRGGLAALPKGQYEAADSLGLDYAQAMRLIILPQALKISIPGIVNVAVGLFKDTTLVSVISMFDLVGMIRGPILASTDWNGVYWELFSFAALLFFVVCYGISQYSQWLERRLATDHR